MRIPALPSYIKTHELRPARLKNEKPVVIDGQNFLYNMYEDSKINFELGCETDRLREYVRSSLGMFARAGVTCYFVFKGGDLNIERKLKKHDDYFNATTFDFIESNRFVPPIFMKDACKQILHEMDIDYTVCEFESKRDCVALAETLKCPVISNDIEFCFLQATYIDSSTLRYDSAKNAIHCKQYMLKSFLAKHSLTEEKLAIFVVLTDIQIFPENFFNKLLVSLNITTGSNLHKRYTELWRWLAKVDAPSALDAVKRFLSDDDRLRFMDEVCQVIDFMKLKRTSYVVDYFFNRQNLKVRPADPHWFEKGVASKKIAIPYINLYHTNYWLESLGIETEHSDPSQLAAAGILKYAYNLLTNFKRDKFVLVVNTKRIPIGASVSGVDTKDKRPFEDGWDDIKERGYFEKFLTANSIDVALISQIERKEAALLIVALVYYARKKSASVSREACAIIICYVIMDTRAKYSDDELQRAADAAKCYFSASKGEVMRILDKDVLYRLAEYQHCLRCLNDLNALCGAPYTPTVYHRAYSGTGVCKLLAELERRERARADGRDAFMDELFAGCPSVLRAVKNLIGSYDRLLNA